MEGLSYEEKLEKLRRLTQEAKDRAEIKNLFSTYQYNHSLILDDRTVDELYAQNQEDVRHDWGEVLEGVEELKKYYIGRPRYRGKMIVHSLANPVIYIAEDGKTAKGIWFSIGHESTPYMRRPTLEKDHDPVGPRLEGPDKYGIYKFSHWVWNKYGVDFIKENGRWKIWHLRTVGSLRTHFDMDWIEFSISNMTDDRRCGLSVPWQGLDASMPLLTRNTRATTKPQFGYQVDRSAVEDPELPQAYDTFEHTFSY